MGHSRIFTHVTQALRVAALAERGKIPTREALEQFREDRRKFLKMAGLAAGGTLVVPGRWDLGAQPPAVNIGIVGAGLAGLSCAYELKKKGIAAQLYDANDRVGGRCWSLANRFPGQVVERGGELIDNLGKTMLGYVQEFGLQVEDMEKQPGDVFYYFNRQRYPESAVVDEYRAFVDAMRADLSKLSNGPTADAHNAFDVAIDNMSISEYLDSRGAGSLLKRVIGVIYDIEYGLEPDLQSALNLLMFIHADKRSKFTPFGVFSDERYHIVGGNEQVVAGLRNRLADQINLGLKLVKIGKKATGQVELTFDNGSKTIAKTFDAVVIAIPFTTLRETELDASLAFPQWKRDAIDKLGYGSNAKLMIGFNGPLWRELGSNGASYSDLTYHQNTWETNPTKATSDHAVLTDYTGGALGAGLDPTKPQTEAGKFLGDLDNVYPGALNAATQDAKNNYLVHLEHWPSNPLSKGSYTCYRPGQFTSIAGNEGKPIDKVYFAGEHTNSFYEWQGFMEGAALSGIDAAQQILADLKK